MYVYDPIQEVLNSTGVCLHLLHAREDPYYCYSNSYKHDALVNISSWYDYNERPSGIRRCKSFMQ